MKRLTVFVMTLLLIFPMTSYAEENTVHYISLGDSLAYGITPDSSSTHLSMNGYSDLLANHFEQLGKLEQYDKSFAYPGYTTDDVLRDIKNNKKNKKGETIQKALKDTDIVTISAGANDVLKNLDIDAETGEANVDYKEFSNVLKQVSSNLNSIVIQLKELNPEAEIYIMGYYNPFPRLPETEQVKLNLALTQFNRVIKGVADSSNITFIPVRDAISKHALDYLPDATNVHPNAAGYLAIANEYFAAIELQEPSTFTDIPDDHFAKGAIDYLTAKSILRGYGDGTYAPDKEVTRGEASLMINRSIIYPHKTPNDPGFRDVKESMNTYKAIARLKEEAVIDGYGDNYFHPEQSLTRDQMAKILVNAFDLETKTSGTTFPDVDPDGWAYPYIQTLLAHQITTGYGDGTFRPKETVTREQLAAFLSRSLHD